MVDIDERSGIVASPAGERGTRAKSTQSWQRTLLPYALLAPSLLLLVLFTYLPIVRLVVDGFFEKVHGQSAIHFVGLANYQKLLADAAFQGAAWNNLIYAVGSVLPSLAIALFLAIALERSSRFNAVLRSLFFFPSFVPLVAAASLCFFIFLPRLGLLDFYLAKLGVGATNWIGDPDIALWALVGLTVWKNAGYYMLFYLAGLQAIPKDAYEAAMMEGATAWQRFWHVTLPLLKPTTSFVLVIALIQALTQVDHVIVLTKGGPSNSTNLLLYYIYMTAVENFDYGRAAAASVLSVGVLLAISALSLRTMERGMRHV